MKTKTKMKVIILVKVYVKIIKAKLGMTRRRHVYLAESEAIQKAMEKNEHKLIKGKFAHHSLWKKHHRAAKRALKIQATGLKGGTGMVRIAFTDLKGTLNKALDFINAEARDNQGQAVQLIESVLMKVINPPKIIKEALKVKALAAAGCVKATVAAAKYLGEYVRATYEWAYSIDKGRTWIPQQPNHKSFIIVKNMASNVPAIFRSRTFTEKGGTTAWVISKVIYPK